MKICMLGVGIISSANAALSGAHVNSIATLSKRLVDFGHDIHIVGSYHPLYSPISGNAFCFPWAKVHPIDVRGRYESKRYGLEFLLKAVLKIKELHRKEKFDIIHGHSGNPLPAMVTGISGWINNIPSIHTLYCPIKRWDVSDIFARFYLRQLGQIIAISDNVQQSLNDIVPDIKIRVIPPGIDLSLFNPTIDGSQIRANFRLEGHPVLLYLGNASETKGVKVLIDALSIVIQKLPNVRLLMALDPAIETYEPEIRKLKKALEKRIEYNPLDRNIVLVGLIKDIPSFIATSDIFITPFLSTDGPADYPLSLLEAMAIGKPVIASKVGGIPEVVKEAENGILVEPGDVDSLAKAIIFLLEDREERQKMGGKGYELIKNNFSAESIAKKMEKIYEEVT